MSITDSPLPRRRCRSPIVSALLVVGLSYPALAVTYHADPSRGEIVVHTDRSGLFGFAGHRHRIESGSFSGTIDLDPEAPGDITVRLTIPAGELVVADDTDSSTVAKIERKMRSNVLGVETYPLITFVSSRILATQERTGGVQALNVAGDLTLHGQTRPIEFGAYLAIEGGDVHVVGSVTVKQTDFGIEPVSAGLGTVKIKDEVAIEFDVWASRDLTASEEKTPLESPD